jgi:hypothetical protein
MKRAEGRASRPGALNTAERWIARAMWRVLIRRGWAVQANPPEFCSHVYKAEDGRKLDAGWRPIFSIRYGKTPVYRGPGEVRWINRLR